eukprot:11376872-Alexandrium_andersonii.AAC.1
MSTSAQGTLFRASFQPGVRATGCPALQESGGNPFLNRRPGVLARTGSAVVTLLGPSLKYKIGSPELSPKLSRALSELCGA